MAAFGRQMFVVCRTPCSAVVQGGAATLGRMALMGAQLVLQSRAPRAFAALQGVRSAVRKIEENSGQ
jgi:hypothetical protein